jgi:hypothetical protein
MLNSASSAGVSSSLSRLCKTYYLFLNIIMNP